MTSEEHAYSRLANRHQSTRQHQQNSKPAGKICAFLGLNDKLYARNTTNWHHMYNNA
jgi:hypothetical protein